MLLDKYSHAEHKCGGERIDSCLLRFGGQDLEGHGPYLDGKNPVIAIFVPRIPVFTVIVAQLRITQRTK